MKSEKYLNAITILPFVMLVVTAIGAALVNAFVDAEATAIVILSGFTILMVSEAGLAFLGSIEWLKEIKSTEEEP